MMEYKEPKRTFEDSGFVDPAESYYVQFENIVNTKNQNMKTMVDKSRYFSIFAPRQSGKTTFFKAFSRDLEKDPKYIFILLSFENFSKLSEQKFYKSIEKELYPQLIQRLRVIKCPQLNSVADYFKTHELSDSDSFITMLRELNIIIKFKKIVIFIDEFDGIPKQEIETFLPTLRKLYQEYKDRKDKALYSVGLVGIRNVTKLSVGGVSPFNIADHLELPVFTLKNIRDLYGQYTQETNQSFTEEAVQKVFEQTGGQPWLVNRLGNLTINIKPRTIDPITLDDVDKAVNILLEETNDHFTNLLQKLNIYKNTFYNIAQSDVKNDPDDDEQSWLRQYGLIKKYDGKAVVANEIYKKRFYTAKNLRIHIKESQKPKPLIFLCHAKEDIEHVKKIYEKLEKAGFNPWMDEIDILPGQNWDHEIQKAINITDFALIFLSKLSVEKRGYVNKEIKWAIDRQAEKLEGDIFLIPVQLEKCDLPHALEKYQAVDLDGFEGFERIISTIKYQFKKTLNAHYEDNIKSQIVNVSLSIPDLKKKIFISYYHEDQQWLDKFLNYLSPLEYEGIEYLDIEIQNSIADSQIFVCFISNNYLGAKFVKKELPEILNKNKEEILIMPILVAKCAWKVVAWLKKPQLFPIDSIPLVKKNEEEQEEILIDIVNEIGGVTIHSSEVIADKNQ